MFYLWINEDNEGWELVDTNEDQDVLKARKIEMSKGAASSRSIARTSSTKMFKITDKDIDDSLKKGN